MSNEQSNSDAKIIGIGDHESPQSINYKAPPRHKISQLSSTYYSEMKQENTIADNAIQQVNNKNVDLLHPTEKPKVSSNKTFSDNGKRKLELNSKQVPTKRATLTTKFPKTSPNLTGSELMSKELCGNISAPSIPAIFANRSATEIPCVKKEHDLCIDNSGVKNKDAIETLAGSTANTTLQSSHVAETGMPPSSLSFQSNTPIQMQGKKNTVIPNVTTKEQFTQQQREHYHLDRKRKFLTFMKTLMRFLEINEQAMHLQAKDIIRDCSNKKKQGDLNNVNLGVNMQYRLRNLVGETIWKKTEELLKNSMMQDLMKRGHLSLDDAKAEAEKLAKVAAAPLCGTTHQNGTSGSASSVNHASCTLQ